MSDRKFTFIELHLEGDHQFGPRTIDDALPFGEKYETAETEAADPAAETADADAEEAAEGSSSKGAIGALVALAVLVALGVAAKKYRGDDEDEALEADEEPDVIVN
ncbi:hypothetical protein D8Y22_08045 [Salinadaptatus halalkaliphilus]|uniref:Uncharacterized protein n=1 Tax=Salinadaptatus halalkaliphilus TaxID=2419781 RepID=A0A4S3TPL7_9EURY|nr:hypothetical protein [Salinadaptatus halalkaliphilus]THE65163.1 hypothetical protein D8Y22_08045 [Salinadaptatus halalkaliphilus]